MLIYKDSHAMLKKMSSHGFLCNQTIKKDIEMQMLFQRDIGRHANRIFCFWFVCVFICHIFLKTFILSNKNVYTKSSPHYEPLEYAHSNDCKAKKQYEQAIQMANTRWPGTAKVV